MFTFEQFDALHALWDGTLDNAEICRSCGACCDGITKSLFPGEYDYLVARSGQKNLRWCSQGCLCHQVAPVKSIICKLYPLQFDVSLSGVWKLRSDRGDAYTTRCQELLYASAERAMSQFVTCLFNDVHNRAFYLMRYRWDDLRQEALRRFDRDGVHLPDWTAAQLVMAELLGIRQAMEPLILEDNLDA